VRELTVIIKRSRLAAQQDFSAAIFESASDDVLAKDKSLNGRHPASPATG
jgi:hypothetical protein